MKSSEQLRAGQALIKDPNKWIKGQFINYINGKFCMIGALYAACPGRTIDEMNNRDAAVDFLGDSIPNGNRKFGIPFFNDHPSTTHAEIMKVYEDAIKLAEEVEDGVEVHIDY